MYMHHCFLAPWWYLCSTSLKRLGITDIDLQFKAIKTSPCSDWVTLVDKHRLPSLEAVLLEYFSMVMDPIYYLESPCNYNGHHSAGFKVLKVSMIWPNLFNSSHGTR